MRINHAKKKRINLRISLRVHDFLSFEHNNGKLLPIFSVLLSWGAVRFSDDPETKTLSNTLTTKT